MIALAKYYIAYGRLSVMTQWLCEARSLFNVSKQAFTPPPKVASSVVRLTPRKFPLAEASWADMETVTAAAFGQRRKVLRQSLKPGRNRNGGADCSGFCAETASPPSPQQSQCKTPCRRPTSPLRLNS